MTMTIRAEEQETEEETRQWKDAIRKTKEEIAAEEEAEKSNQQQRQQPSRQ